MTRERHRQHGNPFTVRGDIDPIDYQTIYGRNAPLAIDIGFGGGSFLIQLAQKNPQWNVLGIEIRRHFIENALLQAKKYNLNNCYAVFANANSHLNFLIPPNSTAFVSINFPDPWFKKRHHKRRVVSAEWLKILLPKLQSNAQIHAVTDFEPLALEIRNVLQQNEKLKNMDGFNNFAKESTTFIQSERENTHLSRNEPIYRMCFSYL